MEQGWSWARRASSETTSKMYQGVALIGRSLSGGQALRGLRRHPTLEDHVTIYAGTTIMGAETVVGAQAPSARTCFLRTAFRRSPSCSTKRSNSAFWIRKTGNWNPRSNGLFRLQRHDTARFRGACGDDAVPARRFRQRVKHPRGGPAITRPRWTNRGKGWRISSGSKRTRLSSRAGEPKHAILPCSASREPMRHVAGISSPAPAEHHAVLHAFEQLKHHEGFDLTSCRLTPPDASIPRI